MCGLQLVGIWRWSIKNLKFQADVVESFSLQQTLLPKGDQKQELSALFRKLHLPVKEQRAIQVFVTVYLLPALI